MARLIFVIGFALLAGSLFGQSSARVMFYNVENLMDTINDPVTTDDEFTPDSAMHWNSNRYADKLEKIAQVISSSTDTIPPLFIGLAEIENKQVLQDLIHQPALKKTNWGIVHHDSPDKRGIDVALLYNSSIVTIIEEKIFPVDFPFDSTLTTRDILYAKAELGNKSIVHIFVVHFPSRREGKTKTEERRTREAFLLRLQAENIIRTDKNAHIIIMGDFNDNPHDKSVAITTFDISLFNLMESKKDSGQFTLVSGSTKYLFDQIIVSRNLLEPNAGLSIKNNSAEIYKPDWLLFNHPKNGLIPNRTYVGTKYTGGYSDHLPVYVDLQFK